MKICKECNIEKPIHEFSKHKTTRDGLNTNCKMCIKIKDNARQKRYYKQNKELIKKAKLNRIDKEKKYKKIYRIKNKTILSNKAKIYRKLRKDNDPLYLFKKKVSSLISKSFSSKNFYKKSKSLEILGCDIVFFREYLESQFESWMNWDNKGLYNGELNYGWDIDHIIPLSTATCEADIIRLNHYTNLQPLCSKVNRHIKKDKTGN